MGSLRSPLRLLTLFFLFMLPGSLGAQDPLPDLPDRDTFLGQIRAHLRGDRLLQSQYTFNLKQTEIRFDRSGNPAKTEVNEYEIFPSLDEDLTYRRHISKNGEPLSPDEIAKQDREHDRKLKKSEKALAKAGVDKQIRYNERQEEERRKEDRIIDEIFHLYDFAIVRREVIDGCPAILLSFQPNPRYKPATSEAKLLMKLSGQAWFCEADQQLMRVEVKLLENISFGLGFLARLNKGATATFQRRRVNNEIWLPEEAHFSGTARLLLIKGLRLEMVSEFSNYRKFTVETSIKYSIGTSP
jgi:hypothetical protein